MTPSGELPGDLSKLFSNIPLITFPNSSYLGTSEEDKADAIAVSLENQFQGNHIIRADTERRVNDKINDFLSMEILNPHIQVTVAVVLQEIKTLKNK